MTSPSAARQLPDLEWTERDDDAVRYLRALAADAVQRVGNGHPGTAMALAPVAYLLFQKVMRHDPRDPSWLGRDRFVLSPGHSSLTLYSQLFLSDYGLSMADLESFRTWGSRTPGHPEHGHTAGVETTTGPLGQGLATAVGMAMALRLDGSPARVFCEFSDGALQEGSTWEAAMGAATFKCDNLVVLIDCNGIQADGPVTVRIEPVADKMTAFGWETREINGNDMDALVGALAGAREKNGKPKAIVMRTTPGFGIPTIMARDRAHFVRIDNSEWDALTQELEKENG